MGMEGEEGGYNCTEPVGVQFCKNGLFFVGCTYGIYGNNVHCVTVT